MEFTLSWMCTLVKKNYRIGNDDNPITVWCALWTERNISTYFFKNEACHNLQSMGNALENLVRYSWEITSIKLWHSVKIWTNCCERQNVFQLVCDVFISSNELSRLHLFFWMYWNFFKEPTGWFIRRRET